MIPFRQVQINFPSVSPLLMSSEVILRGREVNWAFVVVKLSGRTPLTIAAARKHRKERDWLRQCWLTGVFGCHTASKQYLSGRLHQPGPAAIRTLSGPVDTGRRTSSKPVVSSRLKQCEGSTCGRFALVKSSSYASGRGMFLLARGLPRQPLPYYCSSPWPAHCLRQHILGLMMSFFKILSKRTQVGVLLLNVQSNPRKKEEEKAFQDASICVKLQ